MVVICSDSYPTNSKYDDYFALFPYDLSDFQKYAIEAIVSGHHVLTTAHTGSGKTLSAEFAIQHFVEQGKKVVYTSPIKALSNQKYYEFTRKYPHIQFGLMTGDIKTNPTADVLIMTTEILMNHLFKQTDAPTAESHLTFQLDIAELACVVFDEVHYINDEHRGQVWEQTILMLPPHVQMVMLSATIDQPERFAKWCEARGDKRNSARDAHESISNEKRVYLASTNHRVVPLTHYGYVAATEALFKTTKDKTLEQQLRKSTNKLIMLQTHGGAFSESGVKEIAGLLDTLERKDLRMKRKFVLNNLATFLKENEMLPAIGFVFSRKHVELCAHEITAVLLPDDSKVPYIVRRECEQIIRKLPNFQEYLELPEYQDLMGLLEKGIAIHHSGMIPILREIVELMVSKKYVQLLFATESFAIGLDCPIKTAIMTGLTKFDGSRERYVYPHEYTQMAGRAGRRGIDTVGHVVHCNNLFAMPTTSEYKILLSGKPQTLVSKFHVSYSMILNLLKQKESHPETNDWSSVFETFANKSMMYNEIQSHLRGQREILDKLGAQVDKKESFIDTIRTPADMCEKYNELESQLRHAVNKKRNQIERDLTKLKNENQYIVADAKFFVDLTKLRDEYAKEQGQLHRIQQYTQTQIERVLRILTDYGVVSSINNPELTNKGQLAAHIAEINPVLAANSFESWRNLTAAQWVGVLAAFVDIRVPDEFRKTEPVCADPVVLYRLLQLAKDARTLNETELENDIGTFPVELRYDMVDELMAWATECHSEQECKWFLQTRVIGEKGVSTGDMTKACMKLSTIAKELCAAAELAGWVDTQHTLSQIDGMILKYIATTQSLYV